MAVTHRTSSQKLFAWLMAKAEADSMIMAAAKMQFVLTRSAKYPIGMFIRSATMFGTVATSEASNRLSRNSRTKTGMRAT